MSTTVITQRCLVIDDFALPFLTQHGIDFHYTSRASFLDVPLEVPISSLKRFYKPQQQQVPFKRSSKPRQFKRYPVPVHEKPQVQASSPIKTVPLQNQERELSDGSVTKGAAPSPRHMPIPMFYVREKIKESFKETV